MRARLTATLTAAVLALTLAGCTSDDPQPDPTSPPSDAATDAGRTVESFAQEMLERATATEPDDLGTVSGAVGKGEVDVQVVAMTAGSEGSELVLELTGETTNGDMREWSDGRGIYTDVRGIVVSGADSDWKLKPYTIPDEEHRTPVDCSCSRFPKKTTPDDPIRLQVLLPALEEGTTEVTVEIPGLDPVTDVPVTWR